MTTSSYDALPYEDYTFPPTHPEHLHVLARVLGHPAPSYVNARVLELGCARGANLHSLAIDLPNARFVGVDLSTRQIDDARATAERVGLTNVTFRAASIDQLDDLPAGSFDYVICHGVYSWVPPTIRDAIFDVSHRVLAPGGLAYVSFNALPGWSLGRIVRDFLAMHVSRVANPADRVTAARELLRVLSTGLEASPHEPGTIALRAEVDSLRHVHDAYLFHEYLEEVNEPVYFRDFAEHAARHGLEPRCDADVTTIVREGLLGEGSPAAHTAHDRVQLEQTLDFMRNRRFRASMLVRAGESSPRAPTVADIGAWYLSSRAKPAVRPADRSLRTRSPLAFALEERRITLQDPVAKCALLTLAESPRTPIAFPTLCERAAARAAVTDPRAVAASIARELDLPSLVFGGFVELHGGPARYALGVSANPIACPLARDQATRGAPISTRRHHQVELGAFERGVLPLLDGTRDRGALVRDLEQPAREGRLGPVDHRPGTLPKRVDEALETLAADALLVG